MDETLGCKLKLLRTRQHLTLRQVEEATGISNAYLSQLENDKIKNPSISVLYKLISVYKITLEDLFKPLAFKVENSITDDEEKELLNYLEYIRFKKSNNVSAPEMLEALQEVTYELEQLYLFDSPLSKETNINRIGDIIDNAKEVINKALGKEKSNE